MTLRNRWVVLTLVAIAAAAAVFVNRTPPAPAPTRLSWIATAHQFGPVGYRDPAGAISPDGRWIAYSEGRFLRVRSVDGGPLLDLPPGEAQIRNVSWHPDNRSILADGFDTQAGWGIYDRVARTRRRLSPNRDDVRQATWSSDGRLIAIVSARDGQEVWELEQEGKGARLAKPAGRVTFPTRTPGGETACIVAKDGRSHITIPCGGAAIRTNPDVDAYGPIAFAPDGRTIYVALANAAGTVDLWTAPVAGGRAHRLTSFSRDTYAPSVAADGSVMFKVQSYRTAVAVVAADGGPSLPLAMFQSETPSWDPSGRWLGITYGTWRRVPDDAQYPDIAQDAGIIGVDAAAPAGEPARVVHKSASEDQSLCWSPNGKWIAFHSHQNGSDDVWLRPANDDNATARRISFLGRGAETGWPRWSPDGHWLLFDGADKATGRSVFYLVGVDQESGATVGDLRRIDVRGLDAEMSHAEWLPDSAGIVAIAKDAPGRHVIFAVSRDGGDARIVFRFATEHDNPGLAVSPDGHSVAFIAPAADGFFQVFKLPAEGGAPIQVTNDPTHKTQPAWSPDGRRIAFTVWSYEAQFWRVQAVASGTSQRSP